MVKILRLVEALVAIWRKENASFQVSGQISEITVN